MGQPEDFGSGCLLSEEDYQRYSFRHIAEHHGVEMFDVVAGMNAPWDYQEYVRWYKETQNKLTRILK